MDENEQQQCEAFRATVDKSVFTNEPYSRRVEKPWGWEIHFTPDSLPYFGKVIHIDEGKRWSLQVHDAKQESWTLGAGNAILIFEAADGSLPERVMKPGEGYTCQIGQKHRIVGGAGGCDIFEVSTPEIGRTFRLEDDYSRKTETVEERERRNRGEKVW